MEKNNKDIINNVEVQENNKSNEHTDFVTSYFSWIELEEQKKIANKLNKIGKKSSKDNK